MFQLTRPRGARHGQRVRAEVRLEVSTHAPARGATGGLRLACTAGHVSTHAPARGATFVEVDDAVEVLFQLTRPRGARLLLQMACAEVTVFQLTRPRGARRLRGVAADAAPYVSTHAPARGATGGFGVTESGVEVSTHAPARGATVLSRMTLSWAAFQLTRPRGARQALGGVRRVVGEVSTHAPARGATRAGRPLRRRRSRFNSRAREGRDAPS